MPTLAELRTRSDGGVEIVYTRRAVIQGVTPVACTAAITAASTAGELHAALQRLNFFNDDELLFSSEDATVVEVTVTTAYEETI